VAARGVATLASRRGTAAKAAATLTSREGMAARAAITQASKATLVWWAASLVSDEHAFQPTHGCSTARLYWCLHYPRACLPVDCLLGCLTEEDSTCTSVTGADATGSSSHPAEFWHRRADRVIPLAAMTTTSAPPTFEVCTAKLAQLFAMHEHELQPCCCCILTSCC
jgi:hypothetical protein